MSYTRKYREKIAVHYSGSVRYSYPASDKGGSGTAHYNGTTYEDVNVHINVDTDPFDDSVEHCNANVNLLTGAVIATEAAQIASIDKNSKKVANTIVSGFFDYIRSEISQQISELTQGIDAQLMHLNELSKAVVEKKVQMKGDFLRISSRYIKTFDDLNNELSNRVYELDKPTFIFKKELDNQSIRSTGNDLVNTVSVFGKESGELHSKISTSIAKKRAFDTLIKAKTFLWQQKKMNNTVQKSMLNETVESAQYLPVCFIETKLDKTQIDKKVFTSGFILKLQDKTKNIEMINQFSENSNTWKTISPEYINSLKNYFNTELNNAYVNADQHSERVKEMIQKISNLSTININSI